jgi:hypothetical protein
MAEDRISWGYCSWNPTELDSVVALLKHIYPGKSECDLVEAVDFCKGAVRQTQGLPALLSFTCALLNSVGYLRHKQILQGTISSKAYDVFG